MRFNRRSSPVRRQRHVRIRQTFHTERVIRAGCCSTAAFWVITGRHVGVSWEDRDDTVRTKCDHGLLMCWSGQRAANDRGLVHSTEQVVQRVARCPSSTMCLF